MSLFDANEILILIDEGRQNLALHRLAVIYEEIAEQSDQYSDKDKVEFTSFFGQVLFQCGYYYDAIHMFKVSQNLEYSDSIAELICEAFIYPNLAEFEQNYALNLSNLRTTGKEKLFADLNYYLIPTEKDHHYYFFNKHTRQIEESFIWLENKPKDEQEYSQIYDGFSSMLYIEDYEIGHAAHQLETLLKNKKECFLVVHKYDKFLATLQSSVYAQLNQMQIFSSYLEMKSFFETHHNYLPRNVVSSIGELQKAMSYIEHVHRFRLHPANRNRDGVILSVCIPTYNRGHRALENVIQLLNTSFDYEIEILISNNGTKNNTKDLYEEIKNYHDSRITYFEFDSNQGFYANTLNVCKRAKGKFLLLLSDEDSVAIAELNNVMQFLHASSDTAVLKTSTSRQSRFPDIAALTMKSVIDELMLTSNYMSGLIMNTALMKQYNVLERVDDWYNQENVAVLTYPHMCWELLMFQYGKSYSTSTILVREGDIEKMESEYIVRVGNDSEIPEYNTIQHRLDQHHGFAEIMISMEISNDKKLLSEMYRALCRKTFWLIEISLNLFYSKFLNKEELVKIINEVYQFCRKEYYLEHIEDRHQVLHELDKGKKNLISRMNSAV